MPTLLMDHVIEGNLQDGSQIDFAKEKLAVHAIVKGQEVAQTDVDSTGHFKVTFASDEQRPLTELRVTPAAGVPIAAAATLQPAQFSVQGNLAIANRDITISLGPPPWRYQSYHMHGQVFSQNLTIQPAPGLKMDFYDYNLPASHRPEEIYLGTAYTDPEGAYDFNFAWSLLPSRAPYEYDREPDIRVHISQFVDGAWKEVLLGPVDWNIVPDFHRDFVVPADKLRLLPVTGTKPATGFALTGIGLIPVDSNHLIKGHAFTDENDPETIKNMKHRPFAETLRMGGWFAEKPQITTYKVEIAEAYEDRLPGDTKELAWEDVLDSLHNLKWDPTKQIWEHRFLGPDPVTHRFINIDTEPERDWFEHGLKFVFNSAAKRDGFYAFRITGFDAADRPTTVELPVLCFDNSVPEAELEAIKAEKCGGVKLDLTRQLDLKVTAHDDAGHMLDFGIFATRGSKPLPNDAVLFSIPPDIPGIYGPEHEVPYVGILDKQETVTVSALPAALAGCTAVAYNLELRVQGSATNGYSRRLDSQYVRKDINLIIPEA